MNAFLTAALTHLKALAKSATIYVSALIMALPDILNYAQANLPSIYPYLPHAWQDPATRLIGVAVFFARMRTLVKT